MYVGLNELHCKTGTFNKLSLPLDAFFYSVNFLFSKLKAFAYDSTNTHLHPLQYIAHPKTVSFNCPLKWFVAIVTSSAYTENIPLMEKAKSIKNFV